jgi:hypothetical protein
MHAGVALGHAGWEVAVLRVGGGFFERSEDVFSFVVFFLAAIAAVRTFRAVATIVCSAMSKGKRLVRGNEGNVVCSV